MNTYVFAYDPVITFNITNQLHSFIKENRNISSWSKPFEGCYLLKSAADATTLHSSFNEFFQNKVAFVLVSTKPADVSGILNQEVWNWLNLPTFLEFLDQSKS
jgi:hypothetical protein